MSQISFEHMANSHPDIADAIMAIQQWIASHPGVKFVDLPRLARDLKQFSPGHLGYTLFKLHTTGLLRRALRVRDPSESLLPHTYFDESEVPNDPILPDDGTYDIYAEVDNVAEGHLLETMRVPAQTPHRRYHFSYRLH